MSDLFGDGSSTSSSRSPSPVRPRADYSSQGADWAGQVPLAQDVAMNGHSNGPREGFAEDSEDEEESDEEGEEEGEFTTTAAQTSSYGKEVKGLYRVDDVLPEEEFGEITVAELYKLLKSNCINLNPAYQREPVWKADRNEGLIQSIYRNVHVPELLFNVYASAKKENEEESSGTAAADPAQYKVGNKGKGKEKETGGRLVWNCLDGKQRCTAIRKFLDGEFSIVTFDRLTPEAQQIFREKKLRFGYYCELSYEQECDVFRRVQLGMPLQGAETVKAINTEYKWWIDGLLALYAPGDLPQQCANPNAFSPRIIELKNRNKGLTSFFCLVSSLVGGYASTQYRTQVRRDKEMATLSLPSSSQRKMVCRILDRFKDLTLVPQLAEDSKEYKWSASALVTGNPKSRMRFPHRIWRMPNGRTTGRALSPVEFVFLPMLVQKNEELRDGDLLEIIEKFRDLVINTYGSEVKDNGKVWKTMKTFMDEFDPETDLQGLYNDDGSRVVNGLRQPAQSSNPTPASSHTANHSANASPSSPPSANSNRSNSPEASHSGPSSSSTSKRKRRVTSDTAGTTDTSGSSSTKRKKVQQVDRDAEERVQREEREKAKREADELARETEAEEERVRQEQAEEELSRRKRQEKERQMNEEKRIAKEKAEKDRIAREQLERRRAEEEANLEQRRRRFEEDVKPIIVRDRTNQSNGESNSTNASRSRSQATPSASVPRDHQMMQQQQPSRPQSRPSSNSAPSLDTISRSSHSVATTVGTATTGSSNNPSPAAPARRVFIGAKARIAADLASQPTPPPPAPVSRTAKLLKVAQPASRPVQRKRIVGNASLFDDRGRPKQPDLPATEVDELEAYGGRGEDDIILRTDGGAEPFDEEEERRNREVRERLMARNRNPVDQRDAEVANLLTRKKVGGVLERFKVKKEEEPDRSPAFSNHDRRNDPYRERSRSPPRRPQNPDTERHADNGWSRRASPYQRPSSEYSRAETPRQARGSISQTARYPSTSSSRLPPGSYDPDHRR